MLVAPVAQWIRASVFGTEGRGFESLRVYQKIWKSFIVVFRWFWKFILYIERFEKTFIIVLYTLAINYRIFYVLSKIRHRQIFLFRFIYS